MSGSYVVTSRVGAVRAAVPSLLLAAVFVFIAGGLRGHGPLTGIGLVVLLVIAAAAARRGWTRLLVDADGIALSYPVSGSWNTYGGAAQRRAGWSTVHRLVLGPSAPSAPSGQVVQVVLRNDAPMPAWMTSRIIDPDDPEGGVTYAREVPGLDVAELTAAVRTLAPHVEIRTLTEQ